MAIEPSTIKKTVIQPIALIYNRLYCCLCPDTPRKNKLEQGVKTGCFCIEETHARRVIYELGFEL